MENYSIHNHNHTKSAGGYAERLIIHRNSKNILSILFDEVNYSEEKFNLLKKELQTVHRHHYFSYGEQSNEVFSSYT